MNVPKSIFRQYDVRGIVGKELTPELARALGRAFATVAWDRLGRAPVIAVGRDNRPLGPDAARRACGGASPRPAAPRSTSARCRRPRSTSRVSALETDGGLQVTGSHNPPEFNGFKMVLGGEAFHGDEILELWEIIAAERWRSGTGRETSDDTVLAPVSRGHRLAGTSSRGR